MDAPDPDVPDPNASNPNAAESAPSNSTTQSTSPQNSCAPDSPQELPAAEGITSHASIFVESPEKSDPVAQGADQMLDVHPLHEPVFTWKGFLFHIATIVVGLLQVVPRNNFPSLNIKLMRRIATLLQREA